MELCATSAADARVGRSVLLDIGHRTSASECPAIWCVLLESEYDQRMNIQSPRPWNAAKSRAVTALLVLNVAVCAFAQEAVQEPDKKVSALVAAARATKAANTGKKSKMSITDSNLRRAPKRTGSRPVEAKAVPAEEVLVVAAPAALPLAVELASATKSLEILEKELLRLEQSYYDESDPNYRENVIRKRFDDTKRQTNVARDRLSELRNANEVAESDADAEPQSQPQSQQ